MTIDEAIGRLEQHTRWLVSRNALEQAEAHQLGIEALKRCQVLARNDRYWSTRPLPGETEEVKVE